MENSRQPREAGSQFDLPYGQLRILEAFQDKFSGLSPQILIGHLDPDHVDIQKIRIVIAGDDHILPRLLSMLQKIRKTAPRHTVADDQDGSAAGFVQLSGKSIAVIMHGGSIKDQRLIGPDSCGISREVR